ncbi:glycosyltransferase family 4 protein [Oceanobacillus neutriphilus]|uniref:Glycosyltransferase EpsD n=1 Tax=Oceanobacillus neutriphilus TaxID=531815 RepID=A0ABQ2NYZ6_9BACI|nr:glycosyltransferase family 4 protein [Oceanobacillus neutriphilus]GGP14058.1 putative glycosyltransferase EpsD [Oceanobacillus neutriphilus]
MPNKILFCATVDYHFKAFHLPYMKWLQKQGWEVHVAAAGNIDLSYTDKKYNIAIQRSPFHSANIKAYKQLKDIIHQNNYSIIHCHTPFGGVLTRMAAKETRKKGTKVIYTAHGFHFCKGAPIQNWLFYYPIERMLSRYTDTLILINQEDYHLARTHKFKAGSIEHVHGVGVDTEKYKPVHENKKRELRKSFGYNADDLLLFYAAEFNKNKNQQLLLHAMALLKDKVPNAKLLLAGEGPLLKSCQQLAHQLGVSGVVNFLGFRKDINQILPMCDIGVASSLREGLPVNIMEAMACGLPVIAVDNRGHRELIENGKHGWIISHPNAVKFANKLIQVSNITEPGLTFGKRAREKIESVYTINKILIEKRKIYEKHMEGWGEVHWAVH